MKKENLVEICFYLFGLNISVGEYYLINDVGGFCLLWEMIFFW